MKDLIFAQILTNLTVLDALHALHAKRRFFPYMKIDYRIASDCYALKLLQYTANGT